MITGTSLNLDDSVAPTLVYLWVHNSKFPDEISEYFLSSWDNEEIWCVAAPRKTLAIRELHWHLDYPFLSSRPPDPLFDLKPRDVLNDPEAFPTHWRRTLQADLSFPITVSEFGGRVVILDGIHRLLKLVASGGRELECKFVSREHIRTSPERA